MSDILSVEVTKEKDASKSPATGFVLNYIKTTPPYTLNHGKITFSKPDNDTNVQWVTRIEELYIPYSE